MHKNSFLYPNKRCLLHETKLFFAYLEKMSSGMPYTYKNVSEMGTMVSMYHAYWIRTQSYIMVRLYRVNAYTSIQHIRTWVHICIQTYLDAYKNSWNKLRMPQNVHTLKMCLFLKIENSSSWVNFTHFREETHLLALELNLISSSWRVYMDINFDI